MAAARGCAREPLGRIGRQEVADAPDFTEARRRMRAAYATKRPRGGVGWKLGLLIDLGLLFLPIPAVIVIPPLLECRHTAIHVGFFAGDSFQACARRRTIARWSHLDSRIKMIVRNSGK